MAMRKYVVLTERPGICDAPTPQLFQVKYFDQIDEIDIGQVLVKTLYLSVDPYMRCRMRTETGVDYIGPWQIDKPCDGPGVGIVLKSKFDGLKKYDLVYSFSWPWVTTVKMEGSSLQKMDDDHIRRHPSLALGVLGITGITGYLGIKKKAFIINGKSQTVVVSGAAGACGSIAGQVARLEGAGNIIGICGSKEKCTHLLNDLGFNGAINYKTENISCQLQKLCPFGIDVYFDNVGGSISDEVIRKMNKNSHIVLCGQIAVYNKDIPYPPSLSDELNKILMERNIKRDRYLVLKYQDEFESSLAQLAQWLAEGKLKYNETVTNGIENIGEAFTSVMNGGNIGKQIVKVGDIC